MSLDFARVIDKGTPLLLSGLQTTVIISLLAIALGLVIGFLTCMMGISKAWPLRAIAAVYVWVIRGTPMIVQALVVFFGMPQLIRMFDPTFRITPFTAGVITCSLNAGAYLSEVFRGGINAVPKGQVEASRSLGLSYAKTMMKVVLPQAIKISLPSMVNQFIIIIKDTSILTVIGLADLVNQAKVYVGSTYLYFETYILVGLFYLVVISVLMVLSKYLEKRLSYGKKGRR